MKIKSVAPFVLHVPVSGSRIADSTHSITHWGVVGARIETENGLAGYGFTGTHAELAGDHLITRCIATCFAEFFHQEAVHWVQPDCTRMGGVTEVPRVCETAHSYRLPVALHAGDMSQVHVHLSYAHPACQVLEYIPWIKDCFTEPAQVVDGSFRLPQQPGAGTTPTREAWERFGRPVA